MSLSQFSDQVVEQIRCEVVPVEVERSKQLKMVFTLAKSLVILFQKYSMLVCPNVGENVDYC